MGVLRGRFGAGILDGRVPNSNLGGAFGTLPRMKSVPGSLEVVAYVPGVSPDEIGRAADALQVPAGHHLAVLVAEGDEPDLAGIVDELKSRDFSFFGALFPGLIVGAERHEVGALLMALPVEVAPVLVTGLDGCDFSIPELGSTVGAGSRTAMVLVDGLTANVSRLLAELHGRLGNSVHYFGGGAGSLSLEQQPCVFTRDGVFQDAAVVAFLSCRSRLGVRHGWSFHAGPFVATRTEGNVIQQLNWERALDVYQRALQPHLDEELTPENLFHASTAFPFGIYKEGTEDVVRDPVSAGPDGELICVGEVPENAVLNILRGDRASLVSAAGRAAQDCADATPIHTRAAFVVDCISRTLFLDEEFTEELNAVQECLRPVTNDVEMHGILTLGEISSLGRGYVEFLNKTIVVAVLHD